MRCRVIGPSATVFLCGRNRGPVSRYEPDKTPSPLEIEKLLPQSVLVIQKVRALRKCRFEDKLVAYGSCIGASEPHGLI
jgi:hypothetical protein